MLALAMAMAMSTGAYVQTLPTMQAIRIGHSAPMMVAEEPGELKPSERPGNYVAPYQSALGVSAAAVLCGELIRVPGTVDATVSLFGRTMACTSLPLLCTAFLVLRTAAKVGPAMLRTERFQWLNLGVAISSIAAGAVAPMPVLSVIIARGGSALLCLEVWSQGAAAKAGNPLAEILAALQCVASGFRRAIDLALAGIVSDTDNSDQVGPACFAYLCLAYTAFAAFGLVAPTAMAAALWPMVTPGLGGARVAVSAAGLSATSALLLGDVASKRSPSSTGDELRPWRWLNRALLLSATAHVALQALAVLLLGLQCNFAALSAKLISTPLRTFVPTLMAQLLQVATIVLCAWRASLFYS
mmetsp:Transcript_13207/g.33852  ORF Transcript_13207/g.33852 Transcript_13207/m.33852 type:complete len:357 (-) Transcript_13207:222-1292(-)